MSDIVRVKCGECLAKIYGWLYKMPQEMLEGFTTERKCYGMEVRHASLAYLRRPRSSSYGITLVPGLHRTADDKKRCERKEKTQGPTTVLGTCYTAHKQVNTRDAITKIPLID